MIFIIALIDDRALKKGSFTSLVTNFENVPLNSIKIYKVRDLVIFDKASKRLRRIESLDKNSKLDYSQCTSSNGSNDHPASNEEEKCDNDEWPSGRLFIGIVDINKWEEDARSLYNRLLNEGDNFKTQFWGKIDHLNEVRSSIRLPNTIEELKESQKVLDEVNKELEHYDWFMPRNQYFKPHTANAKKFLNNAEFISRQLNIYDANEECVSSFLGIEHKEFIKLLKYYSKPRKRSIQSFLLKQSDKARFDSEIAEQLKIFIKTKMGCWITTRMMRNHLLNVFKQRIDENNERNF